VFSYLPNPRLYKAQITARLCGVSIEVRGAKPRELINWLWDFDARNLNDEDKVQYADCARESHTGFTTPLYKTDSFLAAHPFGTVPAGFSADGSTGVFESNSIMRAVARSAIDAGGVYGRDGFETSRIDSFLDVGLVFARDTQNYLLALGNGPTSEELRAHTQSGHAVYLGGIEQALARSDGHLVGDHLTLADVCFVCELALFSREPAMAKKAGVDSIVGDDPASQYPRAYAHFDALVAHEAFAPDLGPYLRKG
jgi:elongation factor 1-gamma